ncbi:glycosyltransferase [Polynucleobacter sp. 71A-WALBACH]|uniref:glycosyltransferase n=1 Tax=Polynucleobacter sp. 71A-WALBACH TaxID=2689097 RepID=UPI001C0DE144|nr:glycosyltransferase [Polynucleobacter sp. 71A-WALBACH]MBU3593265.1 glycosyltransferase [Polynucleobacter sp. 71A-WALBACH]
MRVAIVHYWLVNMRGGEKVLEALCELYPQADIYTHVYDPENISEAIKKHHITTTFIQKLPKAIQWYQNYLPLMPFALWFLNLKNYDLVIGLESGPTKGARLSKNAICINCCFTPMRYIWDLFDEYYASVGIFKKLMMLLCVKPLRWWDVFTSKRVDLFISISTIVKKRVKNCYGRDSVIIYPPVEVDSFKISPNIGDYYLMFGQLVSYKRPQLAVEAFNASGKKLIVIGQGELLGGLKKIAQPNIEFLGRLDDDSIRSYLSNCKALIFPGLEDFGIVPVEAMASGRPVIAYGQGGALDTVVDGKTGVFFQEQTVHGLNQAIETFEKNARQYKPIEIREWARKFSKEHFQHQFLELVKPLLAIKKH